MNVNLETLRNRDEEKWRLEKENSLSFGLNNYQKWEKGRKKKKTKFKINCILPKITRSYSLNNYQNLDKES